MEHDPREEEGGETVTIVKGACPRSTNPFLWPGNDKEEELSCAGGGDKIFRHESEHVSFFCSWRTTNTSLLLYPAHRYVPAEVPSSIF